MIKPYPVVILCGGEGTRLYPMTHETPKSMLMVAGKHFIEHQLDLLAEHGTKEALLLVGRFGGAIESYLEDEYAGIKLTYSYDPPEGPAGTGTAMIRAFNKLPQQFILTYGDTYLDFPFPDTVLRDPLSVYPVMMTIYHNKGVNIPSNVLMDGDRIVRFGYPHNPKIAEQFEYVDSGLIYIDKKCLCYRIRRDISDTLSELVQEGKVATYEVETPPYEIGNPATFKKTEAYIKERLKHGIHK